MTLLIEGGSTAVCRASYGEIEGLWLIKRLNTISGHSNSINPNSSTKLRLFVCLRIDQLE